MAQQSTASAAEPAYIIHEFIGAHPNRGCRSWGLKPPVSSRLRAM